MALAEPQAVREGGAVAEKEGEKVGLPVPQGLADDEPAGEEDAEAEEQGDAVRSGDSLSEALPDAEMHTVGDSVGDSEEEPLEEGEELREVHAEGVRDTVSQPEAVLEGECELHAVTLAEGQGDAVPTMLMLPLVVLDCEAEGDADAD